MNGINAFDKINGISDRFIESSTLPASALAYTSVSPWRKINRFFNSPLGVAILCAVVSLSVVTAIVLAGRGGPAVTPPPGRDTE